MTSTVDRPARDEQSRTVRSRVDVFWHGLIATPARVVLLATLVTFAVIVAVRLGSSLLGWTTFSGVDALTGFAPWRDGWTAPEIQNTWVGDTIDVFLPGYLQILDAIRSGDLPLWSSLNGPGTALMSTPNIPTLAPAVLPLLVAPTAWAVGLSKLIQLVMIVGGMMLWLRRVGATWAAGAFAGLVYCGSGFFVAWSGWTAQASVAATIPLLFWAVEYFIAKRTIVGGLTLSLVVCWLLLGGFPAVAGHALYAAGAYFVVRVVARRLDLRTTLATVGGGALAVLGGVAVSAVQLLPLASLLSDTDTAYRANQFHVQLPDSTVFTLFFPRLFLPHDGIGHTFAATNPIEAYSFVGMAAVALALLAVLAGGRAGIAPGVVPTLAVTGLLAAAIVWQQGFWTEWLADFPVFAANPAPRLRDLVALTGSALAGLGLNLLFRRDLPGGARRRLFVSAWVIATVAVVGTIGVAIRYQAVIDPATFWVDALLAVASVVLIAVAFTVALPRPTRADSPGRFAWSRRSRLMTTACVLVIVMTGTQVLNSTAYFWPVSDTDDFYPVTPGIAAAQDVTGSGRAVVIGAFPGSTAGAYGIRTLTGHTFQAPTFRDLLVGIDPNAYTPPGRSPTYPVLGLSLSNGSLANPLLDRAAVDSVLASPDQPVAGPIRMLDGAPSAPLGPAAAAVSVGAAGTVVDDVAPQPFRGFVISLTEPLGDGEHGVEIALSVRDRAGHEVAAGSAIRLHWPAGWHQIAVAGEGLADSDGPLSVGVAVRSQTQPELRAAIGTADGRPDLRLIGVADDGLVLRHADSDLVVWERSTSLPRVRWADRAIVLTDPVQRMATLADPQTPRSAVVLGSAGPDPSGGQADLSVTLDTGDEVAVDVDAAGGGYLVLADAVQSGWTVTIDGDEADLVEADHAFGAVFVPEGQHRVTFSYAPSALRIGAAISAIACLIAVVLLGLAWYRARRRRAEPGPPTKSDEAPAARMGSAG